MFFAASSLTHHSDTFPKPAPHRPANRPPRRFFAYGRVADDARAGPPISYGELKKRVGMELLPGVEVQ